MGKKQKKVTFQKQYESKKQDSDTAGGNSLKDLLQKDVLAKLKQQAEEVKQEDAAKQKAAADAQAEAKRLEQKRLENDFNYLLENSDPNWSKYK